MQTVEATLSDGTVQKSGVHIERCRCANSQSIIPAQENRNIFKLLMLLCTLCEVLRCHV